MHNQNLFTVLRAGFPANLDTVAIDVADGAAAGAHYTWRDLERGTAMLANLLHSLGLPAGSRVAVQTEKSVEAVMLYLAVLRAGLVFLPLNSAYQAAEIEYFITDAEPAVVVCAPKNFAWVSRIAFTAGSGHVFTLGEARDGGSHRSSNQVHTRSNWTSLHHPPRESIPWIDHGISVAERRSKLPQGIRAAALRRLGSKARRSCRP